MKIINHSKTSDYFKAWFKISKSLLSRILITEIIIILNEKQIIGIVRVLEAVCFKFILQLI